MSQDRLRLRLPKGVLPYVEVVDEFLLLTQSHQRKGTKKFPKLTATIAPANNRNQTSEANSYTLIQLQFITNGGFPSFAPTFNCSTVATVSFTCLVW